MDTATFGRNCLAGLLNYSAKTAAFAAAAEQANWLDTHNWRANQRLLQSLSGQARQSQVSAESTGNNFIRQIGVSAPQLIRTGAQVLAPPKAKSGLGGFRFWALCSKLCLAGAAHWQQIRASDTINYYHRRRFVCVWRCAETLRVLAPPDEGD